MILQVKQANEQLMENQWRSGEPYRVGLGGGRPGAPRLDPPAPFGSVPSGRPAFKNPARPPSLAPAVSHRAGISNAVFGRRGRAGPGARVSGRGLRVARVRA